MMTKENSELRFENYDLTGKIIDAIISAHQEIGPGFPKEIYRNALVAELKRQGIGAESDKEIAIHFRGEEIGRHTLDVLVEERVVLGLKIVEQIEKQHYSQLRSFLRAAGLKTGLLVNFAWEKADFRRVELS